jgi:alpha-galactosidase
MFLMRRWIRRFRSTAGFSFLSAFLFVAALSPTYAQVAAESDIRTPPPSPKPQINGPTIYGVHPGHPLLYRVPATGDRTMTFSAKHLPAGLRLDPATGILRGVLPRAGNYDITLKARNALGTAKRHFRIVAGGKIALTPPMGWSTWYMVHLNISDAMVRQQTNAMISSGLVNYGYSFIDIDDGWNIKPSSSDPMIGGAPRDADGNLRSNSRFPEMAALADYVHSQGLKIGIYISPGPLTCGGFEGSYQHEAQDARLFAKWGYDLLKYDLCSYRKLMKNPSDPAELKPPYQLMGSELAKQNRDFVYNLCEYGNGDVWKWGREVGGNFWRTTGDVGWVKSPQDSLWDNVATYGFGQAGIEKWAGPGGWNDPDNLLLGKILWDGHLMPTPLTHNEQYTYMTLWSLMDAPLLFGGDMMQLDPFTLGLLTNSEVIAVDQDALGKQAAPVARHGTLEVWAKPMEDGSIAVGLFNRGDQATTVIALWSDLGIHGKRKVRDLWRQKDVGKFNHEFHASVGPHGAELFLFEKHPHKW